MKQADPTSDFSSQLALAPPVAVAGGFSLNDTEFQLFRELLLKEVGISLGTGKRQLVASRLAKRLRSLQLSSYQQYYEHLMTNDPHGDERLRMINCLTTNKTGFFRENHHFQFLREHVFPELRQRTSAGEAQRLRIWSAACSTGEEPYSIAMTIREEFGEYSDWDIRVLASDIDTDVLQHAKEGIYDEERLEEVPEVLRKKYFLRGKGRWAGSVRVRPNLKELITFRRVNLIHHEWPVRARFHVIFCRNVIIYFDRDTQRRLFEHFHTYLHEYGYLLVGHSENLHWLADLYTPVRSTIYRPRPRKETS